MTTNEMPVLSVVIPCFNEEDELPMSMPPLFGELEKLGVTYEVILVNNGSRDRTPEIIDELARTAPVRRVDVPTNRGYGLGAITGFRAARGARVCLMWADSQVAPDDVRRALSTALLSEPGALVKVSRITREDGWMRLIVSVVWNGLYRIFFGGSVRDVNACPKIFYREDLARFDLRQEDAFIEAEAMIKAQYLGLRIVEIPVPFHARLRGSSKVRIIGYAVAFVRNLLAYRFGDRLDEWKSLNPRSACSRCDFDSPPVSTERTPAA